MPRLQPDGTFGREEEYELIRKEKDPHDGSTISVYRNHATGEIEKWARSVDGGHFVELNKNKWTRVRNTDQGWVPDRSDGYEFYDGKWHRVRK